MPPHLHRRTPLRQPLPPPGRVLLLPPHHPPPGRRPTPAPQPPLHLRPRLPRGSLRHPVLHRRGPPPHRLQRNRHQTRRPPPLRPPDRQHQPAPRHPTQQTTSRSRRYSYSELSRDEEDIPETTLVKEFVIDPKLGTLAPRAEIVEEEKKLTVVGQLLKDLAEQEDREKAERAAKAESEALAPPPAPEPPTEATILPSLQATATPLLLPVLLATQKRTVISTEVVRSHRTAQWRDPRIWPLPLPVLDRCIEASQRIASLHLQLLIS